MPPTSELFLLDMLILRLMLARRPSPCLAFAGAIIGEDGRTARYAEAFGIMLDAKIGDDLSDLRRRSLSVYH